MNRIFYIGLYVLWTLVSLGSAFQGIYYTRSYAFFIQSTRTQRCKALRTGLIAAVLLCLALAQAVDDFQDNAVQFLIAGQSLLMAVGVFLLWSIPSTVYKFERFVMCLTLIALALWAGLHGFDITQSDLLRTIFSR